MYWVFLQAGCNLSDGLHFETKSIYGYHSVSVTTIINDSSLTAPSLCLPSMNEVADKLLCSAYMIEETHTRPFEEGNRSPLRSCSHQPLKAGD